MIFISILRWLKGTVTFIISGAFPERFISACRQQGFNVWNVKRNKEQMIADTFASDYKSLRHVARKNSVVLNIKEKRGAYVQIKNNRGRIGVPLGILLTVMMMLFYSTRIWKIEVNGCNDELKNWIISELNDNGIKIGSVKRKIDVKELQSHMMIEDDRISWMAINIVGNTAYVEVSERIQRPENMNPSNKISNIIASCDGQIKYIEVYSGQAMVKKGETVCKGDILVSGIMEDQYGKKQLKYARAKILARTEEQIKAEVPLKQSFWKKDGEESIRWFIKIADRYFPLMGLAPKNKIYSISEDHEKIIGLNFMKITYTPQMLTEIMLTETQAKEMAMKILDSYDEEVVEEKIISRTRKAELINDVLTITENRVIEKDIAVTSEIEWDNR